MTAEVKKNPKAGLWERTVVSAFRDLQWLYKGAAHIAPEGSLGLAGLAETALGDGVVSANERLFLLEVKSEVSGLKTEWKKGDEKDAYLFLSRALMSPKTADVDGVADIRFEQSMRGHHFLYWSASERGFDSRIREGFLVVCPYLIEMILQSPARDYDASSTLLGNSTLGLRDESSEKLAFNPVDKVLAARLFSESAGIIRINGQGPTRALPLGLTPAEMQAYVRWLTGYPEVTKHLPINALLTSRNGAIFQLVSDMNELDELLISLIKNPSITHPTNSRDTEKHRDIFSVQSIAIDESSSDFGFSSFKQ